MPDKCDPELVAAFFSRVAVAEGISEDEDEDEDEDEEAFLFPVKKSKVILGESDGDDE